MCFPFLYFYFSSRRRHTRLKRDWSSDVCSSDLGQGYGKFKNELAEVVVEGLAPIQKEYDYLMDNKDHLEEIYMKGAEKASYEAMKMLRKVYRKDGFIPR